MDEKLSEYLRIEPILCEVVTIRKNTKLFKKIIKQTYKAEMENLRNVEVEIHESTSKFVDLCKWPVSEKIEVPEVDVNKPIEEYKTIYTALDYLFR